MLNNIAKFRGPLIPLIRKYYPYIPDKDKNGIENPVNSDDFSLNAYELEIERGHAMAQAWILSESDLKKVRNPRIASWLGHLSDLIEIILLDCG